MESSQKYTSKTRPSDKKIISIKKTTKGGPLAEYMPLLALISIVLVGPVILLGGKVRDIFDLTSTSVASQPTSDGSDGNGTPITVNDPGGPTEDPGFQYGYLAPDGQGWCPPLSWGYNYPSDEITLPGVVSALPLNSYGIDLVSFGTFEDTTTTFTLPLAQTMNWWGQYKGRTLFTSGRWGWTGELEPIPYVVDSSCPPSDPTQLDTRGWAQGTPLDDNPLAVANGGAMGYAGNDRLTGTSLADGFDPGPGNDVIVSGGGNDLVIAYKNNGNNIIQELNSGSTEDILRFDDVASNEVSFSLTDGRNDFTISYPGGSVTYEDGGQNLANAPEAIFFTDMAWLAEDYFNALYQTQADTGLVQFYGNVGTTYVNQASYGDYIIQDHGGGDTLILAGNESEWVMERIGTSTDALTFRNLSTGQEIVWWQQFNNNTGYHLERVEFDDVAYTGNDTIKNQAHRSMVENGEPEVWGGWRADVHYHFPGESFKINEYSGSSDTDRIIFSTPSTEWTFSKDTAQGNLIMTHNNGDVVETGNGLMNGQSWSIIESIEFTDVSYNHAGYRTRTWRDLASNGLPVVGSWWSDRYEHEIGMGSYTITDYTLWSNTPDTLYLLNTDSTEWDITRFGTSNDLVLTHTVSGDTIRIIDGLRSSAQYSIETFVWDDLTTTKADIIALGL